MIDTRTPPPRLVIIATPEHADRLVAAMRAALAKEDAPGLAKELATLKMMAATFARDAGHEPRFVEIRVSGAAPPKGGVMFRDGTPGSESLKKNSALVAEFAVRARR